MSRNRLLATSLIIIIALLSPLIPGCAPVEAADSYAAIVPRLMQAGTEQAVSVALFKGERPAAGKVAVSLSQEGVEISSASKNINGNGRITFNVPKIVEGEYNLLIKGDSFSGSAKVQVENRTLVFVETDKPIYKPGQTIHFRVLTLSPELLPAVQDVTLEVLDAKGIKVFRSTPKTDEYGMAAVDLPLSTEPNLGTWKIMAATADAKTQIDVRVEEYVLPKYEVSVNLPREWFLVSEQIKGDIGAEYSFGKPVQGEVQIKASKYVGTWQEYATFNASIDGQSQFMLPAANYVAGVPAAGGNGNIKIDVTVTEKSTGYIEKTTRLLTVSQSQLNIKLIPSGVVFKPSLPFSFLVITQTPDNQLVDTRLKASITYYNKDFKTISTQEKDINTEKGKALVEIMPPASAIALTINTTAGGVQALKTIEAGYSPSGNFIHVEQISEGTPQVGDQVRFKVNSTGEAANFYYEVLSRDKVVFSDYTRSSEIAFRTTPAMAPSSKLLVYQVLPNSEIAADYIPFQVTAQYPQNVKIEFSQLQVNPGGDVNINIQAEGRSKVGIAAVDKSVFILAENRLNLQQVFEELEKLYMKPQAELHEVSIWQGITTRGTRETMDDAGVIMLSNKKIPDGKEFKQLNQRGGIVFAPAMGNAKEAGAVPAPAITITQAPTTTTASSQGLAEVQRVRQYFPETWLWQEVVTDASGKATLKVSAPDTITTWMLRAVAMSREKGLGIAESQLKVFQPFFLTVDLPFSAIRGEEFPVKVAIYNYLDQTQSVVVQIESAGWFDLLDTAEKSIDMKPNDIGGVEFKIKPTKLGTSNAIKITARSKQAADAVIKTIIVEPEGVSREQVDNLTLNNGSVKTIDTGIPANAIDGSGRVYLTLTSSYLTQTLEGMEKLLQMPFGCGEQNMIVFAPDVFITKYLRESRQLKPEIMAKAETLMLTGYQRELTYRRNDGSFSAFGMNDKSGSIWLTAFVLKSFAQAKDIIYIDNTVLESARQWITSHQNSDGSFDTVGLVIHKEMMGGLQGKSALTAYIAIALLQAGEKSASAKAVSYLESKIGEIEDAYTLALTTYALELGGSPRRGEAYTKLMKLAQEDENGLYWSTAGGIPEPVSPKVMAPQIMPPQPRTTGIEATAYATLALLKHGDLPNAARASRWLVSKRNAYGGYGSTQDTVVTLEALTQQAAGAKADVDLTVSVLASGKALKQVAIKPENFDILQVIEVPADQEITTETRGKGEAIAQFVRRYNMPDPGTQEEVLKIDVNYDAADVAVNDRVTVSVSLAFNPPVQMEAGMTVIDISVPTGFAAVRESIDQMISQQPRIKRYDISGRKVIFYVENMLPGDKLEFSFKVQAMYPVKAKGVTSQAYSYYNPEIKSEMLGEDVVVT